MKQIIRLTESDLHRIVKEAVNKILSEDGEISGFDGNGSGMSDPGANGATHAAGVMQGGGTRPKQGTYDTSAGGKGKFWDEADSRPPGGVGNMGKHADWNVNM